MRMLLAALLLSSASAPAADEEGGIRVVTENRIFFVRPDGTELAKPEERSDSLGWEFSPDGKSVAYVGGGESIHVADADGKNPRRITPAYLACSRPRWSPDGKRLAIAAKIGEFWQVHVMNRDGTELKQKTFAPEGAGMQKFGPAGELAYVSWLPRQRLQPGNLILDDGKEPKEIARGIYVSNFAFSPDGKSLAYGTLGEIVFCDRETGRKQITTISGIDPRLRSHAAFDLCFSPESLKVACVIQFLGGRQQGTKIYGDDEVFVVTPGGAARTIVTGGPVRRVEWVKK